MATLLRYFLIVVAAASIWQVSNGDLTWITTTTLTVFNAAVDALTTLLSTIFGTNSS